MSKRTRIIAEFELESSIYSAEKINEYHEIFTLFDRNNTGKITLNEVNLIIRAIGCYPHELIRKQSEQYGIDNIDFQQFLHIMIYLTNAIEDEINIIEAFRVFDKECQGMIIFIIKILIIPAPYCRKKIL